MTISYCDITNNTFADATGADSGANVLTGYPGLWCALRDIGNAPTLAAGDILYVKAGTAPADRLVYIDCDENVTGWGINDSVSDNSGSPGSEWAGHVIETNYLADVGYVIIWLDDGFTAADIVLASGFNNSDAGGGANDPTSGGPLLDKGTPGLVTAAGKAEGGATAPVDFVGCDASWNPGWNAGNSTAYQVTLDGGGVAAYGLINTGSVGYQNWYNFNFYDNDNDGVDGGSAADYGWKFFHCKFELNDRYGINPYRFSYGRLIHCIADTNGSTGVYYGYHHVFLFCVARENGIDGFQGYPAYMIGCLAEGNANDNMLSGSFSLSYGCVFDGADAGSGWKTTYDGGTIIGCRLTNNADHGLEAGSNRGTVYEDWNVFYNNTNNDLDAVVGGGWASYGGGARHIDTVDADGYDGTTFNVDTGEENRSVELVLNWDGVA